MKNKSKSKIKITDKLKVKIRAAIFSVIITLVLFASIVDGNKGSKQEAFSLLPEMSGTYVLESIDIDYRYDKTIYEVTPFVSEPYVVIKGDNHLINLLKWSGDPKFYVDLNDKKPGKYIESVKYEGIYPSLDVQIYPRNIELRLNEQQTVKFTPVVDIINEDNLDSRYILSVFEINPTEVRVRDTQENLARISKIEGIVDVGGLTESKQFKVELKVYDNNGKEMDTNLIDREIEVLVPIEERVIVIKEEVIERIVIVESRDSEGEEKEEDYQESEALEDNETNKVSKKGTLAFINIPDELEVINKSSDLYLSGDIKIDLTDFNIGEYEMSIDDKGHLLPQRSLSRAEAFSLIDRYIEMVLKEDSSVSEGT